MITKEELITHMKDYPDNKIFYSPNIPSKKIRNALPSYAQQIAPEEIIVLIDDTVFGGAKEGMIITKDGIYSKELTENPLSYSFSDIQNIKCEKKQIYINNTPFFKFTMPEPFPMMRLANFISSNLNVSANIEQEDSTSNENKEDNPLTDFLKEQKIKFQHPSNFYVGNELPHNSKINFCTKCNIPNPEEILALLDTTILKSGKDGIAFCKNKIIWRDSFSDPHEVSYEDIQDLNIEVNGSKISIGGLGQIQISVSDISATGTKFLIEAASNFYHENITGLTEEEKQEKEFIKKFKLTSDNFFKETVDFLMQKAKLKGISNHVDAAIDMFFSVSVDQVNKAFGRDTFSENDQLKANAMFSQSCIRLALGFPDFMYKSKVIGKTEKIILQQESITFELICFILGRAGRLIHLELIEKQGLPNDMYPMIMEPLYENIIVPYLNKKKQSVPQERTLSAMSQSNQPTKIEIDMKNNIKLYMNTERPQHLLQHNLLTPLFSMYIGNNKDDVYHFIQYSSDNSGFKGALSEYLDFTDKCLDSIIFDYIQAL